MAKTDSDYMTVLRAVRIKRPRPPKDWKCPGCGKPDTKANPAYEYDLSTASFQPIKVFWHPACLEESWRKWLEANPNFA